MTFLHLNPVSASSSDFNVDGFEPPTDHGAFIADRAEVDHGFFEAAGIEILRGRNSARPTARGPATGRARVRGKRQKFGRAGHGMGV